MEGRLLQTRTIIRSFHVRMRQRMTRRTIGTSWSGPSRYFDLIFRQSVIRHLLHFIPLTFLRRSGWPGRRPLPVVTFLEVRRLAFLCGTLGDWRRRIDPRRDSKCQILYANSIYLVLSLWTTFVYR